VIRAIAHPYPGANPFLLGLSVLPLLEKDTIAKALQKQLMQLQIDAQSLTKIFASYSPHIPRHMQAMVDYSLKQINAAIAWVEQWLPSFGWQVKNATTHSLTTQVKCTTMDKFQASLITKGRIIPCRSNIPVWKAMKENGYSRSAFLTVRDGTLITDDEILKEGDQIELISVVSGG